MDILKIVRADGQIKLMVNQVGLIQLVGAFEKKFDASLAGSYDWLTASELTPQNLLGEKSNISDDGPRIAVLGCECGEMGCWPLLVTIEARNNVVLWKEFENGHRDWDYKGFGPFQFLRSEYDLELKRSFS